MLKQGEAQRGGSLAKNTGYSCRGTGFDYQKQHPGPQLSETPILGDMKPSSGLRGQCMHMSKDYRQTKYQDTYK